MDSLNNLGDDPAVLSEDVTTDCVQLTFLAYYGKACTFLDKLRYELFSNKTFSSDKLPPTMDAFTQQLKRANYQAYIWLHIKLISMTSYIAFYFLKLIG